MFNKDLILSILEDKGWSRYRLCKEANLAQSTLSDILSGKNINPRMDTIQKIATALNVDVNDFFDKNLSLDIGDNEEFNGIKKSNCINESDNFLKFQEFKTAESAMQFILSQPSIMAYGGFDVNRLSDQDKIDFANDLLSQLKLLGLKYNK